MRRVIVLLAIGLGVSCNRHQERSEEIAKVAAPYEPEQTADAAASRATEADGERPRGPYTSLVVHHVIFHQTSGLQLKVRWLLGRMYPTRPGAIPTFDDPTSFNVEVLEGTMAIPLGNLASLLNTENNGQAKLKNVKISVRGPEEIQVTGILHKMLPIQIIGHLDTTAEGKIRIQITKLKVMKMPIKRLLGVMKISVADLLDEKAAKGVAISGNTILLDTNTLFPPPRNIGKISAVRLTKDGDLEEIYGKSQRDVTRTTHWRNYLQLSGGAVKFGKLTMSETELIMIDTTQNDWFNFDLSRYRQQLAEGDMRMTRTAGLEIFLPDVTKLKGARERPSSDLHWMYKRQEPVTSQSQ